MISNDEEKYNLLYTQIEGLINPDEPIITNFSNSIAAIKQTFSKISWVGIYFTQGDTLYLGPFQGKVACTRIKIGDGVCGTAAKSSKSIVVIFESGKILDKYKAFFPS